MIELQEWKKLHDFYLYNPNYSTKNLAAFLDVSPRTIQRWIKGTAQPSVTQLAQIRAYLEGQKKDEKKS